MMGAKLYTNICKLYAKFHVFHCYTKTIHCLQSNVSKYLHECPFSKCQPILSPALKLYETI